MTSNPPRLADITPDWKTETSITKRNLASLAKTQSKARQFLDLGCPAIAITDELTGEPHAYVVHPAVWDSYANKTGFVSSRIAGTKLNKYHPPFADLLTAIPPNKAVTIGLMEPICVIISAQAPPHLLDFIQSHRDSYDPENPPSYAVAAKPVTSRAPAVKTSAIEPRKTKLEPIMIRVAGKTTAFLPIHPELDFIRDAAESKASIFINGESGTGKEGLARFIHHASSRRDKPFFTVNCAAIPKDMIEAELFGHERGSFTGADKTRQGLLEQADGGTLFLDEITEIPIEKQGTLLHFLQEGEITPVGARTPKK